MQKSFSHLSFSREVTKGRDWVRYILLDHGIMSHIQLFLGGSLIRSDLDRFVANFVKANYGCLQIQYVLFDFLQAEFGT